MEEIWASWGWGRVSWGQVRQDPKVTLKSYTFFCSKSNWRYVLSCVWLFATLWTVATRLFCPWNFLGKNSGLGCHFLLQGLFPTQRSNLHLLHWQMDSFPLAPPADTEDMGLNLTFQKPSFWLLDERRIRGRASHWGLLPVMQERGGLSDLEQCSEHGDGW